MRGKAGAAVRTLVRASRPRLFLAMQAGISYWRGLQISIRWLRSSVLTVALVGVVSGLNLVTAQRPRQGILELRQGHAAWQFLRAVLRADYEAAYGRLAPEVRQSVGFGHFAAAARPLWKSGQRHQQEIELYKLGVRMGDHGATRSFYTFAFAADSSLKIPTVLLEVTFRDTASRAVLGFALRAVKAPVRRGKPAAKATN